MNWFQVSSVRRMCGAVRVSWLDNSELKQKRFWATHVNRKWGLFPLNMLWRYKFVLLSFFTLTRAIWLKILAKPSSKNDKSPLPADLRRSKTSLLKLPNVLFISLHVNRESLRSWIPCCGFWTPDTGFRIPCQLILDYGLRLLEGFRIPGTEFRIPRVEFQIPKAKIPDSTSKRLPGLHWWGDSLKPKWSKEWKRYSKAALNKEEHFKNWMFIYYLYGSQLASVSFPYRVEPQRDHPLKDPGKDNISVLCLTLGRYAIYS